MEFGIFHEFPSLPGRSHAEAFAQSFELVDGAERWGLDTTQFRRPGEQMRLF